MIPKTPITHMENAIDSWFQDHNEEPLDDEQIARDLTEFYEMKRRQEECGKMGHSANQEDDYCGKCGADLTKGATHES